MKAEFVVQKSWNPEASWRGEDPPATFTFDLRIDQERMEGTITPHQRVSKTSPIPPAWAAWACGGERVRWFDSRGEAVKTEVRARRFLAHARA